MLCLNQIREVLGRRISLADFIDPNMTLARLAAKVLAGRLGSTLGLRATTWIAAIGASAAVLWLVLSPVRGIRDVPDAEA